MAALSTYNLLSAWPGAFQVGDGYVGIVDLDPWGEGFGGDYWGLAEGADVVWEAVRHSLESWEHCCSCCGGLAAEVDKIGLLGA